MSKGHYILYIPGLGDTNPTGQRLAMIVWRFQGVQAELIHMNWADSERFAPKLDRILKEIDRRISEGYTVSLVAASAGAGAALNAYAARLGAVHSVTLICGQVLGGHRNVHPGVFAKNGAFYDSMQMLGDSLDKLDDAARSRVVSVHPKADEAVPVADTKLPGAAWRQIPTVGHFASIAYGLTIGSRRIIRDIKRLPGLSKATR